MNRLMFVMIMFLSIFALELRASGASQIEPGPIPRTEEYCLVVGEATVGGFGSKVKISVDFGNNPDSKWRDSVVLKDQGGKPIKFESVIDALNYLNSFGWELLNAFPMSSGQGNAYHYMMRRKITGSNPGQGANVPAESGKP